MSNESNYTTATVGDDGYVVPIVDAETESISDYLVEADSPTEAVGVAMDRHDGEGLVDPWFARTYDLDVAPEDRR